MGLKDFAYLACVQYCYSLEERLKTHLYSWKLSLVTDENVVALCKLIV